MGCGSYIMRVLFFWTGARRYQDYEGEGGALAYFAALNPQVRKLRGGKLLQMRAHHSLHTAGPHWSTCSECLEPTLNATWQFLFCIRDDKIEYHGDHGTFSRIRRYY